MEYALEVPKASLLVALGVLILVLMEYALEAYKEVRRVGWRQS